MARPRVIAPNEETLRVATQVSETTARRLRRVAKQRGVTVAQVIRDALEQVA